MPDKPEKPAPVTNNIAALFLTLKRSGSRINVKSQTMGDRPNLTFPDKKDDEKAAGINDDYVELTDGPYQFIYSISQVVGFELAEGRVPTVYIL